MSLSGFTPTLSLQGRVGHGLQDGAQAISTGFFCKGRAVWGRLSTLHLASVVSLGGAFGLLAQLCAPVNPMESCHSHVTHTGQRWRPQLSQAPSSPTS